jgi:glycosyltransferase involved in cell wall biosynthesis
MAAGVAVVATRVGGVPYQIRQGLDGVLVPSDSPEALGDAIELLLTDPDLRQRVAAEGRGRVDHRFPYDAVLKRVERIYSAAIMRSTMGEPVGPESSWE